MRTGCGKSVYVKARPISSTTKQKCRCKPGGSNCIPCQGFAIQRVCGFGEADSDFRLDRGAGVRRPFAPESAAACQHVLGNMPDLL